MIFTADSNGKPARSETSAEAKTPARSAAAAAPQGSSSDHSSSDLPSNERAFAETPKASAPSQPSSSSPDLRRLRPATRSTDGRAVNEFRLQELGENISQGDLVRLMIAPGAKVSEGQPVMELETDKAVVEVPSTSAASSMKSRSKKARRSKLGK